MVPTPRGYVRRPTPRDVTSVCASERKTHVPHNGQSISTSKGFDPSATPSAPAHTHAKVTTHQNGSHVYYNCVHTEVCVCVCYYDHRWVPTPNMHQHMVRNVMKAMRDTLARAMWPRGDEGTETVETGEPAPLALAHLCSPLHLGSANSSLELISISSYGKSPAAIHTSVPWNGQVMMSRSDRYSAHLDAVRSSTGPWPGPSVDTGRCLPTRCSSGVAVPRTTPGRWSVPRVGSSSAELVDTRTAAGLWVPRSTSWSDQIAGEMR